MNGPAARIGRRAVVAGLAAAPAMALLPSFSRADGHLTRPIPKSGERIPALGLGTWITFNVGDDAKLRAARTEVLRTFFEAGGGMVDSSPMYGSPEAVIGHGLKALGHPKGLFSATKVWTPTQYLGVKQMQRSEELWGLKRFDLFQVHNLLDWEAHLETLAEWKASGRVRYVGITTSHGSRHDEMAEIIRSRPIDFVQFTYNAVDREAEARLLPLAADKGIAVIINRPFQRGHLIERVARHPLPAFAAEAGARTWPQFLLKFVISHPAVTCAIPATSRVDHMRENMAALSGPLPDAALRTRMAKHVESL